jgi:hypothetical protein
MLNVSLVGGITTQDSSMAVIVGCSVSGAVVLALAAVLTYMLIKKGKKSVLNQKLQIQQIKEYVA